MAYTYDDFLKDAQKDSLLDKFSQEDLQTAQKDPNYGLSMLGLMRDASTARTPEAKLIAEQAAQQLRKSYGAESTGSSFQYDKDYQVQKLLNDVVNPTAFSYDASKDPVFSAIKKAYLREGERAGKNTLAQVSAATGGVPSSWAVTAAQQANNYYGAQVADQIPTLEQNAYQRYIAERQEKLNALAGCRCRAVHLWLWGCAV